MTDSTDIDSHLLRGMEAELVTTRDELARAAAHNADVEAELFAVAQRLAAKEAEHEAALNALKKTRAELFEARTELEAETQKQALAASQPSFAERAVRKVKRAVKR